jgi:hypothetical protein
VELHETPSAGVFTTGLTHVDLTCEADALAMVRRISSLASHRTAFGRGRQGRAARRGAARRGAGILRGARAGERTHSKRIERERPHA